MIKANSNIKVMYVKTTAIQLMDIPRAFEKNGVEVHIPQYNVAAQGLNEDDCNRLAETIEKVSPAFVISYDFSETIAQACHEMNTPYASWVYDNPQQELYTEYAQYPGNFVFVFDKMQEQRMKDIGLTNVYYMPLAVLGEKVKKVVQNADLTNDSDITFVGQLYQHENLQNIYKQMPDKLKSSIDRSLKECFLKWNDEQQFFEKMDDDTAVYLSSINKNYEMEKFPFIDSKFFYEISFTARLLANKERVFVLNHLAEKYRVNFYTFDKKLKQLSDRINVIPGAKYDTEVSKVYYDSKINLNITLHCIESGACQRIFDVMAAGGFMISNYQKELEELFVPGKEIVLYHNLQELDDLIEYYLENEEERKMIALNGQKRVIAMHEMSDRMSDIIEIIENNRPNGIYKDLYEKKKRDVEITKAIVKCDNISRMSAIKGLEMLLYYIMMMPREFKLLMKKAEYLMDFGMFREALECMQEIENPDPDIICLIEELKLTLDK